MVAAARTHDTGQRSDFDWLVERCARLWRWREGKHPKPPYNSLIPFDIGLLTYVQLRSVSVVIVSLLIRKSRLQVTLCQLSRPKRSSAAAIIPTVAITCVPRRQTTPMTAKKSAASPWEAAHESQTLRAVSLYAAGLDRPLRSRCHTSRVREVRWRTTGSRQALPT